MIKNATKLRNKIGKNDMDYEKKYKEALALMVDYVPDEDGFVHVRPHEIFSELKESEDERTRKCLLKYFENHSPNGVIWNYLGISRENVLVWLEKQAPKSNKWTEEDDSKVDDIVYFLDSAKTHYDCIAWLKSLKQRMEQ